jgi:hypothetical protein
MSEAGRHRDRIGPRRVQLARRREDAGDPAHQRGRPSEMYVGAACTATMVSRTGALPHTDPPRIDHRQDRALKHVRHHLDRALPLRRNG